RAMCNTMAVRLVQGVCDRDRHFQRFLDFEWPARQASCEGFTLEIFGNEIVCAFLAQDIDERAYVRMIQSRNRFEFAVETFAALCSLTGAIRKRLDHYGSVCPSVGGLVGLRGGATDRSDDLVWA